ncbi:MAG TPA: arsenic resistance N-acetyltransferase ArsN2 [Gemmatimonadaceae bacterium]|nr:arsenic resistance N-acetyltransferase ArsN2 [Gemmatimonadaceae bacterium]
MHADDVTIRGARAEDLAAVRSLLSAARLPLDGLDEQFGEGYAVAESAGNVIGAEGIETYEDAGLLRSAVVHDSWRGRGIGDALTRDRLDWARSRGLREVYLLTTTAADYFPRHGFSRVDRASAPAAVQRSREFAEACPQTAVAMRLVLHAPTTT